MSDNRELIAEAREWTAAVSTYPGAGHFIRKLATTLEAADRELAEATQMMVELQPDPVLVEGSWFPVKDLPKILGNYMRSSAEYAREAKREYLRAESAHSDEAVGDPEREALIDLLQSAQHAPMETHNHQSGECIQCPWPLHELGPVEIADAILAAGYRREPLDSTTGENRG